MSETWFTADLHLGHANIIKFCVRPFLSVEEKELASKDPQGSWRTSKETVRRHDAALLDAINAVVQPNDTLWVLGDFCWGDINVAKAYRNRINCRNVHLVWGNHDKRVIEPVFGRCVEQTMIKISGQHIWLNHYPMRSWNKAHRGCWQLYGHVHGRLAEEDAACPWLLTKDVGVDACDYRPISFQMLSDYMAPRLAAFQERGMV